MASAPWDLIFGGMLAALLVAVGIYAGAVPQGGRRWWGLAGLVALLVLAAQAVGAGWPRTILLDAAELAALALVWDRGTPAAKRAARNALLLLVPAMVAVGSAAVLVGESGTLPGGAAGKAAAALFVIGWSLKLALVPFYFWLPGVAEAAAPLTTALFVGVVDIAAFGELAELSTASPWLFSDYRGVWISLALLSMFGGALLALGQRDLKRMLAFSTVDDMGYLLLGLAAGPVIGLTGALLGALSHALCKVLLFGAVGIPEWRAGRPLTLSDRGLAGRFPVSAAAFIAGSLGMIGVPPLLGFAGRWRLYLAGAQLGGPALLIAMAAATGLALLYYARAIHLVWLGPETAPVPVRETDACYEPRPAAAVLVVLMIAAVALGVAGWLWI